MNATAAHTRNVKLGAFKQAVLHYSKERMLLAPTCRWCSSLDWYSMKCAMYTWEAQRGKRCSPCCGTLNAGGSGAGSCIKWKASGVNTGALAPQVLMTTCIDHDCRVGSMHVTAHGIKDPRCECLAAIC